jgi:hypothetical protein
MGKPQNQKKLSELGLAAQALEVELARFDELAEVALRSQLNSEKNIERAAKATMDAAACQERVAEKVQALVATIVAARDKQQATAERIVARAQEIQSRGQEVTALMQRFIALGEEARGVVQLVQALGGVPKEEVPARVGEIEERLLGVVSHSQDVAKEAQSIDMMDIARQADSIRQQVYSARNRLKLLQNTLITE